VFLAVRTGLEPATPCVTGMYSNQLNYRTGFKELFCCVAVVKSVAKIAQKIYFAKEFGFFGFFLESRVLLCNLSVLMRCPRLYVRIMKH
jgi:hypothetical protein